MPSLLRSLLVQFCRTSSAQLFKMVALTGLLLAGAARPARAQLWVSRPAPPAAAVQNETATPSLSRHVHDVQRVTGYLVDALRLSTAQEIALQHCAVAERSALLLAVSEKDAQEAQARYLASVRRLLASSQLRTYVHLQQQLEGTLLPLDGLGLAAR